MLLGIVQARAQTVQTPSFANAQGLGSGSFFPIRTVASITHVDPADSTKDIIDSIDFDGDGNSDIVQADGGSGNRVTVWLRQDSGQYTSVGFNVSGAAAGTITDLAVADVNGDDMPDIIVAAGGSLYVYTNDGVNNSQLSFTLAATLTAQDAHGTTESFMRVAAADLSGDGLPEIVATSTTVNTDSMNPEGHVTVFKHSAGNNATYDAGVVYVAPLSLGGAGAIAIAPVVGGDANLDVIVSDPTVLSGRQLAILPGKGDGTLVTDVDDATLPAQTPFLTVTGTAIAVGDIDGDGNRDIFVAGSQWADFGNGPVQTLQMDFLHSLGAGGFDAAGGFQVASVDSPNPPSSTLLTDIALGDFNLDGTLDVVVADTINHSAAILSSYIFRDTQGAFVFAGFTLPFLTDISENVRCVATAFTDSDANIDLITGTNTSTDTEVLLNTTTPPAPPLTGKKIAFEFATYTGHVNTDASVVINVNRASDSTGSVTVPFTVSGTAIPNGKPNSDYSLDVPSNKKIVFADGEYQKQIVISLSFDNNPAPPKTIILTLGKPVGDAVLSTTLKTTTVTLVNSNQPTIHAANALSVTPSNVIKTPAAQLKTLGLKAIARSNSPWKFTVSQTLDKKAPGLGLKVQYSANATGPWNDFPNNFMSPTKPGGTTWTTTSSAIPEGTKIYFHTVTSATGYQSQSGAAVGGYGVLPGPKLTLTATQCPTPAATNSNNFTPGSIDTHNSEGITYRFAFGNSGDAAATNVTIDIPLNTHMTHLAHFTSSAHVSGSFVMLDNKAKVTTNMSAAAALQYRIPTLNAGASDTVDVQVTVVSAAEYNPTHPAASFGLPVDLPAYRITAVDQNAQVYGTPSMEATIRSPLSVTLAHDTNIASPGGLVVYTATLKNLSGVDYTAAKFSVKMPFGAALESVDIANDSNGDFDGPSINPTGGTNPSVAPFPFQFGFLQTLTWNIGTIPGGHTVNVKFTLRVQYDLQPDFVDSTGTHHTAEVDITNYNLVATPTGGKAVQAFTNDDDGPPARVLISAYDPAALPQIGFVKVATGLGAGGGELTEDGLAVATVLPNDSIQYDLVYFNTGGSTARGCVIQEEIASGATFIGFMNLNGTDFNPNQYVLKDGSGSLLPYKNHTIAQDLTKAKSVEFHVGDVAPNSGGTLSYRVAATTSANKYIISQGYQMFTESLRDPRPGKPAQVPAKVVQPISFDINTDADKAAVAPGDTITYTIRFRNNGGVDAKNMVVTSPIPVGTTFVSSATPKLANEYGTAFAGASIVPPVAGSKKPVITFNIPTLAPDESFVDANGNGFHETDEAFTDGNGNHVHDGEGIAQFTVQVQNPLPTALRVPNTILENTSTITGFYSSGAVAQIAAQLTPKAAGFTPAADKLLTGPSTSALLDTRILDPLHANLWAYKSAPHFVTKGQRMLYKVVAGNSGNIAVNNVQAAIQVPFGTTLDAANTTAGYKSSGGIVTWNLGNLAPHTAVGANLVVIVKTDASYTNDTLEENSCSVKSVAGGGLQANAPEVVPGPSRTTVLSTNPIVSAWQSFCAWLGSLGGNLGHSTDGVKNNVQSLDEGTLQVSISGVDVIALQNGGLLIQNGGGNIVAAGGGNIVAAGGGNIVAAGGGNIVAAGGGNIVAAGGGNAISVSGVGFCTQANLSNVIAGIVAAGGGNIVAAGGGNLIANDGMTLLGLDGSPIVAQGGGNLHISPNASSLVAAGGGNIVAAGGGNIVAAGGGNIVAAGGGNIVAAGGGNVVAQGAGNIVAAGGGN